MAPEPVKVISGEDASLHTAVLPLMVAAGNGLIRTRTLSFVTQPREVVVTIYRVVSAEFKFTAGLDTAVSLKPDDGDQL